MVVDSRLLTQAASGALEILRGQPLTLKEFINETMECFMDIEPGEYVKSGKMHEEWLDIFSKSDHTAIICARGHLKTTFSLALLAYFMHRQHNFRALYISATLEQAWDKLEQFEEMCNRSWRLSSYLEKSDDIKVTTRKGAKYFNNGSRVHAASIGKSLEGPHVHFIILDDVLQEFPNLTDDKVIHYIRRVVMPMRLPDANILLVGTQKRVGDVTEWVCESKNWKSLRHPALLENGHPRWPEYWSKERLEKEKETMGSRAFESEYMLNPLDPMSAVIPYEVLRPCLSKSLEMGLCPDGDDWYVVMGVDLAVGMDSVNDETAYVIVAYNRETEIRQVLYSWSGKMQAAGSGWLKGQVSKIRELAQRFNPDMVMVESNGYQRLVVHAAQELEGLPVEGHNTGREKHSHDVGIPNIALQMEKELYRIPWNARARVESRPGTRKLVDGLSRLIYGKHGRLEGHTPDPVIALWMCELALQKLFRQKLAFTTWDYL